MNHYRRTVLIGILVLLGVRPVGASTEIPVASVAVTAPLDADALRHKLADAEIAYRQRQTERALAAFREVLALDPRHPRAQLRVGNLHHQAGRDDEALKAYALAAEAAGSDPGEARIRMKAHMNLAWLHLDLAERALASVDQEDARTLRSHSVHLSDSINAFAQQDGKNVTADLKSSQTGAAALAVGARKPPAKQGLLADSPSSAGLSVRTPLDRRNLARPYTVDRWMGHARRPPSKSKPGRALVLEPVTETPLPAAPKVESVQGAGGGAS
jgi:hypothetical protein